MERFDRYEMGELQPSASTMLDRVGMQPHSREYLEDQANGMRSQRKLEVVDGQVIDYCDGIQFSNRP